MFSVGSESVKGGLGTRTKYVGVPALLWFLSGRHTSLSLNLLSAYLFI